VKEEDVRPTRNGGYHEGGGSNTSQSCEDSTGLSPNGQPPAGLALFDSTASSSDAPIDHDVPATAPLNPSDLFGSPINAISGHEPASPSAAFNEAFWTDQSLDAILSASLPTFDLAMYGQAGDVDPLDAFRFSPAFDFEMSDATAPPRPLRGGVNETCGMIRREQPALSSASETNNILTEFCEFHGA
jgi:hypothetical protein